MNGRASTKGELVGTDNLLPRLTHARPLDDRKVQLRWRNGESKIVDLGPALASRRVYIPLRENDALFRTLRVSEYGDAIEWDDGLDFSALWLERLPAIGFSNANFRDAMRTLGLSLDGMAAALEVSRRLVADYRKDKPIPRHIALATQYLVIRSEMRSEVARSGPGTGHADQSRQTKPPVG